MKERKVYFTIYLPLTQLEAIEELAKSSNVTTSEKIRELLTIAVKAIEGKLK